jgi:hypothetical protein
MMHLYVQVASATGPEFQRQNPVMLAELGHYLPGFMIKQSVSGRYRLVGIEMTSSENAVVDYGYADELDKNTHVLERGLRVMDAVTFLAMEALGDHFDSDADYSAYEYKVLEKTARKYSVPLNELETINQKKLQTRSAKVSGSNGQNTTASPSRRRPGAFGDAPDRFRNWWFSKLNPHLRRKTFKEPPRSTRGPRPETKSTSLPGKLSAESVSSKKTVP